MTAAMPRSAGAVGPLLAVLVLGCGTTGSNDGYSLPVGSDDGGGTFAEGDARSQGAFDAHIEDGDHVEVTIVTLRCAGDCADVEAVATGGQAPYTFVWDDGSTAATRKVCPTSSTNYSVGVTDTGTVGEFPRPAETVKVPLTARVLSCHDGGATPCEGGGVDVPASGLYAGTFYCPPDADGGILALPSADGGLITGDFWVNLAIDPSNANQTGTLYGKWVVLGVIAFQASLQGTLDCSTGEFSASWVNGVWGLPGPVPADASAPLSVIAAGMPSGDLTASVVSGSPRTIAGALDWFETSTDNGSRCHGTYTATLQP
jgi:hypothetical protein